MKKSFPVFVLLLFIITACNPAAAGTKVATAKVISSARATSQPTTIAPTQKPAPEPTSTKTPLDLFLTEQEILEKVRVLDGFHGIYIHEIGTPKEGGINFNKNKQLHGASTVKIAIAAVVLKVMQLENLSLDEPLLQNSNATAKDLIHDMVVNHDEGVTAFLLSYVNNSLKYNFDKVLADMGLPGFNVEMRLATPESMGQLLERLYTNDLDLNNNLFLLYLVEEEASIDTLFTWAINDSLPGTYYNKVGAIYDINQKIPNTTIKFVANDAGIWISPQGHSFVVVLYGNYGTEKEFLINNSYIKTVANILKSSIP
jgi:hypothetical protein